MTDTRDQFRPLAALPGATAPSASRRLHPRDMLQCSILIVLASGGERHGTTVDLSRDGLSLSTDRPIPPGQRCVLWLQPPGQPGAPALQLQAKSVYSSYAAPGDFRIGMVFVGEDAQSGGRLTNRSAG